MTRRAAKVATPYTPPTPAELADNPIPWLTSDWLRDGAFEDDATGLLVRLAKSPEGVSEADRRRLGFALDQALGALRSTVSGLQDTDTPYTVRLGRPEGSAYTVNEARLVEVGSGPLLDPRLTPPQRAAVMAGLVFHEVGHVRLTRSVTPLVRKDWAGTGQDATAHQVANILEDVRTEAIDRDLFPGLAPALDAVLRWVSDRSKAQAGGRMLRQSAEWRESRIALIVAALRFPWIADFEATEAERDMIREAAGRALASPTLKGLVAVIRELTEWVLEAPTAPPPPLPEPPTEDPDEDEDPDGDPSEDEDSEDGPEGYPSGPAPDEDEDEDGPKGSGDPEGDEDPEDEDSEDEDSDSDPEDSEDEDEDPDVTGPGSDSDPEDDEDEDSEDEDSDHGSGSDEDDEDEDEGDDSEDSDSDTPEDEDEDSDPTEGDEDEDSDEDDEDSDSSSEGEGEDSDSGDEDSDSDSTGGDDPGAGDEDDEWRGMPEGCIGDEARRDGTDSEAQSLADYAHNSARKVERSRRYPTPLGTWDRGGVVVREREVTRGGSGVRSRFIGPEPEAPDLDSEDEDEGDEWGREWSDSEAKVAEGSGDIYRKRGGKRGRWYSATTTDRTDAGAAIADAISSARRGHSAPERGCRSGRLDRGRLAKVANHDPRVFIRREAASPERVRVYVLIDCSGSMYGGGLIYRAAQVARDLAVALDSIPWATARMYAHTTDSDGPYVVPLWRTGEDRERVSDVFSIQAAGNHDGYAISYVADDLIAERTVAERSLLVVISDGMPAGPPVYVNGNAHTKAAVDYYRRKDVRVVSVSIDPSLSGGDQAELYGQDVVNYDSLPAALARNLARVIGSSI